MDDWDVLEGVEAVLEDSQTLEQARAKALSPIARELAIKLSEFEHLKAQIKALEKEVVRFFPQEEGSHHWEDEAVEITVSYGERRVWDKNKLAEIFGAAEMLPAYVDKTYTVNNRKFDAMGEAEKGRVREALTRKLSAPKIDVAARGPTA